MANKTKSIKIIIMNYNLGEYSDELYSKLINDGFEKEDIMLVDNGSDKAEPAKNTGLALPWNVRASGQMNLSMRYLYEYFPQDYYMILTTSSKLYDDVNYKEVIDKIVVDFNPEEVGFITSSLSGGNSVNFPTQDFDNVTEEYQDVGLFQPMLTIYSHKLIDLCVKDKAGCFNLDLIRGHGMEIEMKYLADINGLKNYVAKNLHIEWLVNNTHKNGLADEPRMAYKDKLD